MILARFSWYVALHCRPHEAATAGLVAALIVVIIGGCGGSQDNGEVNAIVIEGVTVVDPERGEARPDQPVVIDDRKSMI